MKTDVRGMLLFIRYLKDSRKLGEIVQEKHFRNMNRDMAEAIRVFTGADIILERDEKGKVDMCKALEDMKRASRTEGRREGREEGCLYERIALLSKAIDEGVMTYETAARLSGWDEKEFRRRLNRWRRTKKS